MQCRFYGVACQKQRVQLPGSWNISPSVSGILQASPKPEGDKYAFTHFAHKLMSS